MANEQNLNDVYYYMMHTMVERGQAPHYTELASQFSVPPEEGKALLHALLESGFSAWVYPDTDYIASFAPFNNLPTQYRITVGARQSWFGQ